MRNISILFLLTIALSCPQSGQKGPIIKEGVYDCILTSFDRQGVGCGILAIAEAMKFNLSDKEDVNIAVVIRCPEIFGEGFWSTGKKYKLTLTSDSSSCKGYLVYNLYRDSLHTYFALNVVKN